MKKPPPRTKKGVEIWVGSLTKNIFQKNYKEQVEQKNFFCLVEKEMSAYLQKLHKNSPRSTFLSLLVAVFSAALVSATDYPECDEKTIDCDVEVNDNEALYKFTSRYSSAKNDRMWFFYGKAVPFATSDTHESAEYLNDWRESDIKWESEDEYLVGWYSDFDGGKNDRRFKMRYRTLATGYTRGD